MKRTILVGLSSAVAGALLATALLGSASGVTRIELKPLFAQLRGSHEVGSNGRAGAGDPDGRGSFTAIIEGRRLCFGIVVVNTKKPVAAHIHKGAVGENGDAVVPLKQPGSGKPAASSGCVTIGSALVTDIRAHPGSYYANVHTSDFPNGALRGQLFQPSARQDK